MALIDTPTHTTPPTPKTQLHSFLRHVSGFDLVDDESKPERRPAKRAPTPAEWTSKHNPAFAYYTFYVHANLYTLNRLREARGLNTFALRPHAGEAGDVDHLATALLLCENVAHGINLRRAPTLQYLFYAAQVGLCMSPLSNNSLFLDYHRNPFPQFFARGLSGEALGGGWVGWLGWLDWSRVGFWVSVHLFIAI